MAERNVLVFLARLMREIGYFQGIETDIDRYIRSIFADGKAFFIQRSEAESNPEYKQVIPYVLVVCDGKLFSYIRSKRSGETRLKGFRSVGFGGHVNETDISSFQLQQGLLYLYENAVDREIREELRIESEYRQRRVAVLNYDGDDVGKVHFGIIHVLELAEPRVELRDPALSRGQFLSLPAMAVALDEFERWSQICIESILTETIRI